MTLEIELWGATVQQPLCKEDEQADIHYSGPKKFQEIVVNSRSVTTTGNQLVPLFNLLFDRQPILPEKDPISL